MAISIGALGITITTEADQAIRAAQQVKDTYNDLEKSVAKNVDNMDVAFRRGFLGGNLVQHALAGMFNLASEAIVGFNVTMETAQVSFSAMARGAMASAGAFVDVGLAAQQASQHIKDLQRFAQETPFELKEVTQASVRLQAYGFAMKDIIPLLRTVGDVASAAPNRNLAIERITLALGQIQSKGHLMAQEINQLSEAGVPALQFLSEHYHKTTGEIQKLVEKGMIPANEALGAILTGMQTRFGGIMAETQKLLPTTLSNIHDSINQLVGGSMKSALDLVQDQFFRLSNFLQSDSVKGAWASFGEQVKKVTDYLTPLADAIAPAIAGFGAGAFAMTAFGLAITAISAALSVVNPLFLAMTVAAGLFGAAVSTNFMGINAIFTDMPVRLAFVQSKLDSLADWGRGFMVVVRSIGEALKIAFSGGGINLVGVTAGVSDILSKIDVAGILTNIGNFIGAVVGFIEANTPKIVAALASWVETSGPEIQLKLGNLISLVGDWLASNSGWITARLVTWTTNFVNWVADVLPRVLDAIGAAVPIIWAKLQLWAGLFWEWVGPTIPPLIEALGRVVTVIVDHIVSAATGIGNTAKIWATTFVSTFVDEMNGQGTTAKIQEALGKLFDGTKIHAGPGLDTRVIEPGALGGITDAANGLVDAIKKIGDAWNSIDSSWKNAALNAALVVAGIALVVTAMVGINLAVGVVITALELLGVAVVTFVTTFSISGFLAGIGAAFVALGGPIILVGVIIAAAVVAWSTDLGGFRTWIKEWAGNTLEVFVGMATGMGRIFDGIGSMLAASGDRWGTLLADIHEHPFDRERIKADMDALGSSSFDAFKKGFNSTDVNPIAKFINSEFDGLGTQIDKLPEVGNLMGTQFMDGLKAAFESGFKGLTDFLNKNMAALATAGAAASKAAFPTPGRPSDLGSEMPRTAGVGTNITGMDQVGGRDRNSPNFVLNQRDAEISMGLGTDEIYTICGPIAVQAFVKYYGKMPTIADAYLMAKQMKAYGIGPDGTMQSLGGAKIAEVIRYMAGRQSVTYAGGADALGASQLQNIASSGAPLAISTQKHYYFPTDFNAEKGYYVGNSGTTMKGGTDWMTMEQMTNLGGSVQGYIYDPQYGKAVSGDIPGANNPAQPEAPIGAGFTDWLNRFAAGGELKGKPETPEDKQKRILGYAKQIWDIGKEANIPERDLPRFVSAAMAIAGHESQFDPKAALETDPGKGSYGLFQINTGEMGWAPGMDPAILTDPKRNLDIAIPRLAKYWKAGATSAAALYDSPLTDFNRGGFALAASKGLDLPGKLGEGEAGYQALFKSLSGAGDFSTAKSDNKWAMGDPLAHGADLISRGMDALKKLSTDYKVTDTRNIEAFFQDMTDVVKAMADASTKAADILSGTEGKADRFAQYAEKSIALITGGVDVFNKLATLIPPKPGAINALMDNVQEIVQQVVDRSGVVADSGVDRAGERFVTVAGDGFALIQAGVETFNKLARMIPPTPGAMDAFWSALDALLVDYKARVASFGEDIQKQSVAFLRVATDASTVIVKGAEAFNALASMPQIDTSAITDFGTKIEFTVRTFAAAGALIDAELLHNATQFNTAVGAATKGVKEGVDALNSLWQLGDVKQADVDHFVESIVMMTNKFSDAFLLLGGPAGILLQENAGNFAKIAAQVVAPIKNGVDALNSLWQLDLVDPQDVDNFVTSIELVVEIMGQVDPKLRSMYTQAGLFADVAGKVVAPIKNGVDAFNSLTQYESPNTADLIDLRDNLMLLVGLFSEAGFQVGVREMRDAGLFATAATSAANAIKAGLDAFAGLRRYVEPANEAITNITDHMVFMVSEMTAAADAFKNKELSEAQKFAAAATASAGAISAGLKAFQELRLFQPQDLPIAQAVEKLTDMTKQMRTSSEGFSHNEMTQIDEFAKSASGSAGALSAAMSAFNLLTLTRMPAPGAIKVMAAPIEELVTLFQTVSMKFKAEKLIDISAFADTASKVAGALGSTLDAIHKLADYTAPRGNAMPQVMAYLKTTMDSFNVLATEMNAKKVNFALIGIAGDAFNKALGPVSNTIDLVKKLEDFVPPKPEKVDKVMTAMTEIVQNFVKNALPVATILPNGSDQAANSIKNVVESISAGADALGKLSSLTQVSPNIDANIDRVQHVTDRAVDYVIGMMKGPLGAEDLSKETLGKTATTITAIANSIGASAEAFNKVATVGRIDAPTIDAVLSEMGQATLQFAGVVNVMDPVMSDTYDHVGKVASTASSVVGALGSAIDTFNKIQTYVPPSPAMITMLVNDTKNAVLALDKGLAGITDAVATGQRATAANSAISALGGSIGVFLKLQDTLEGKGTAGHPNAIRPYKETPQKLIDNLVGDVVNLVNGFLDAMKKLDMSEASREMNIKLGQLGAFGTMVTTLTGAGSGFFSAFGGQGNKAQIGTNSAMYTFLNALPKIVNAVKAAAAGMDDKAIESFSKVSTGIAGLFDTFGRVVTSVKGVSSNQIYESVNTLVGGVKLLLDDISKIGIGDGSGIQAVSNFLQQITDMLTGDAPMKAGKGFAAQLAAGIKEGLKTPIPVNISLTSSAMSGISLPGKAELGLPNSGGSANFPKIQQEEFDTRPAEGDSLGIRGSIRSLMDEVKKGAEWLRGVNDANKMMLPGNELGAPKPKPPPFANSDIINRQKLLTGNPSRGFDQMLEGQRDEFGNLVDNGMGSYNYGLGSDVGNGLGLPGLNGGSFNPLAQSKALIDNFNSMSNRNLWSLAAKLGIIYMHPSEDSVMPPDIKKQVLMRYLGWSSGALTRNALGFDSPFSGGPSGNQILLGGKMVDFGDSGSKGYGTGGAGASFGSGPLGYAAEGAIVYHPMQVSIAEREAEMIMPLRSYEQLAGRRSQDIVTRTVEALSQHGTVGQLDARDTRGPIHVHVDIGGREFKTIVIDQVNDYAVTVH